MKTKNLSVLIALSAVILAFSSCKKDLGSDSPSTPSFESRLSVANADNRDVPNQTATIPNSITSNFTLTKNRVWLLNGPTYVSNGATLTIQPGTFIKGVSKASPTVPASYLVITKGSKIRALGKADSSIVFTSDRPAGQRRPGDWGGVIILGNSRVNKTNPQIEGIPAAQVPFTGAINYGGNVPSDNSGIFRYVRIEFAGEEIDEGDEINGLTLGGVGSGTELHHVQVSYGLDDGFEFFGGTVNASHLIALGVADDSFDFDFGYRGTIQFGVAQIVPQTTFVPFTADPNGIESDNDASGSTDAPRTQPKLSNFTIVGTSSEFGSILYGNRWRRNSSLRVYNSIIAGFDEAGVNFDNALGTPGVTGNFSLSTSDSAVFRNNIVHGTDAGVLNAPTVRYSNNTVLTGGNFNTTIRLTAPFNVAATASGPFPNFQPASGSPALTGARNLTGVAGTWVTPNPGYKGAFPLNGSGNWFGTWVSFAPRFNPYL